MCLYIYIDRYAHTHTYAHISVDLPISVYLSFFLSIYHEYKRTSIYAYVHTYILIKRNSGRERGSEVHGLWGLRCCQPLEVFLGGVGAHRRLSSLILRGEGGVPKGVQYLVISVVLLKAAGVSSLRDPTDYRFRAYMVWALGMFDFSVSEDLGFGTLEGLCFYFDAFG